MLEQHKAFKNFASSARDLRRCVAALENAAKHAYEIDADNNAVMRVAPALPLVEPPPLEYAREIAAYMVDAEWGPYLTELAESSLRQQKTIRMQQEQLAIAQAAQPRLYPFIEAVAAAIAVRSRSTSPAGNRKGVVKSGASKKTGKANEKQASSAGPSVPQVQTSCTPARPAPIAYPPAPSAVQPATPAISLEAERPFAVAAATPIPSTSHNPMAHASRAVPAAPAKPSGKLAWGGFPRPSAQSATAYCSEGCRLR